ncbi:MAG: cupin domain-containing protein [Pseudomonadota bacterium]|nr:cupin domain-containing protein [Pseudomonadota bacterium]
MLNAGNPDEQLAPGVIDCEDLQAAIDHHVAALGWRLDMITPADEPRLALLSRGGRTLRVQCQRPPAPAPAHNGAGPFAIARADGADPWTRGRAGMQYRDLIAGRLGGRYIASHIRIQQGGPVPDYVHYHQVRFQVIYCLRGWVRVVYEDQGPPFVMVPGDCVLQPPTIRHRVLEASDGLEVIEVGGPAEHATWREHEMELPTPQLLPDRRYGDQRFVRHVAADARWRASAYAGFERRDTGIDLATGGLASVGVMRAAAQAGAPPHRHAHAGDLLFWQVLDGELELLSDALGTQVLRAGDACAIPKGADYAPAARGGCELLEVAVVQGG